MKLVYAAQEQVMHRIRVKLYRNYFPKGEDYIARTDSEATLNIDQVGAARRDRGGLTMDFEDFLDASKQMIEEIMYQLADGFAVNLKYFTLRPNVGGTFRSVHETPDPAKHPLTFRLHALKPLRDLVKGIHVVVESLADVDGWIDEFHDKDEGAVNTIFVPGNMFAVYGGKIELAGDDPGVGLYLVPEDAPASAVKITRLMDVEPGKLSGVLPGVGAGHTHFRIEVRTQYAGPNGTLLKAPRVIKSRFVLEKV